MIYFNSSLWNKQIRGYYPYFQKKKKPCVPERGFDLCKDTLYDYIIPPLMFFLLYHGPLNQVSLHPQ